MPVSVITDIITWVGMAVDLKIAIAELGLLAYLIIGKGWLDLLRLISFWLDTLIIKYTDRVYTYFDKILSGTIFNETIVTSVMDRVYVFVAIFVIFKLVMLFIKYIVNPEMVSDDKLGAAALVKRVVIGMCLMVFLPIIFSTAMRLQTSVLNDNIFGRLFFEENELKNYEKEKQNMGRTLAFNVFQGFWSLNEAKSSSSFTNMYKTAVELKDPLATGYGLLVINHKSAIVVGDYSIDYFPILSTVLLGYTFYLILKYCIDLVVRVFKFFLLQMLGPLAISDYMVNGDSKDMFKSWVKTTLSVYLIIFIRVFSIWFVMFITHLMGQECTQIAANGTCQDSLLYTIGGDADYLLRGLISVGLLAFLMDLPKMLSTLFGLDLEQDASVKGLMNKVGGVGKMLGMGAMAAGGAALGGAMQGLKNTSSAIKNRAATKLQNQGKLDAKIASGNSPQAQRMKELMKNPMANRKEISALRNEYLQQNPKSAEALDYMRAETNSIGLTVGQIGANNVLRGATRGALAGGGSVLPGVKEAMGSFQQSKGSVERVSQETSKSFAESSAMHAGYRKGGIEAWSEERAEELTGQSNLKQKREEEVKTTVSNAGTNQAQQDLNARQNQPTPNTSKEDAKNISSGENSSPIPTINTDKNVAGTETPKAPEGVNTTSVNPQNNTVSSDDII